MKIEVKNTRLLFLYRSNLFKYVIFNTKDKKLISIVRALNIKNRRQRIEYIYDEGIKYINAYYSNDLCKFEDNKCIVQRQNNDTNINGCCRKCPIVTDKGCPSKNLVCKLVYCRVALGNLKLLKLHQIPILKCLSFIERMILRSSFFNTREEILNDLYYGIIYSLFRNIKKEMKYNIKK